MFVDQASKSVKDSFLAEKARNREDREAGRIRTENAIKIQSLVRGFIVRRRWKAEQVSVLTTFLERNPNWNELDNTTIHLALRGILFKYDPLFDTVLERVCRLLSSNMLSSKGSPQSWYTGLCLNPKFAAEHIVQVRRLIASVCSSIGRCNMVRHSNRITTNLSFLVIVTECSNWPILKLAKFQPMTAALKMMVKKNMSHQEENLFAALNRMLHNWQTKSSSFMNKDSLLASVVLISRLSGSGYLYLSKILTLPGIVFAIIKSAPNTESVWRSFAVAVFDHFPAGIERFSATATLSIFANSLYLFQLAQIEDSKYARKVVQLLIKLLRHIRVNTDQSKASNMSWHPILGYCIATNESQPDSIALEDIQSELSCLWNRNVVGIIFRDVLNLVPLESNMESKIDQTPSRTDQMASKAKEKLEKMTIGRSALGSFIQRALGGISTSMRQTGGRNLDYPEVATISQACLLYTLAMSIFVEKIKFDILTGLFCVESFLKRLWIFICELGPSGGLYLFEKIIDETNVEIQEANEAYLAVLSLFCQCSSLLLSIADDEEFFTEQHPFTLDESKTISAFLKNFLFKLVWKGSIDIGKRSLLTRTYRHGHELLILFYDRDARRSFTPAGHWLIKTVRPQNIITEYDKGKLRGKVIMEQMPFLIPFELRVVSFRKCIESDRQAEGISGPDSEHSTSQHIIIKRSRLIEDGFHMLNRMRISALKSTIRVKFYNDLGLAEAGIDQDGVFKEFLEETVKKIFDPQFNLFRVTEEGNRLYPSHSSQVNQDSLDLFNYIGKLLGKAVYEGIVLDVHFAQFFLRHLSAGSSNNFYSYIDDLPAFDPELARNLAYVKRCENVSDLGLTFEWTEDVLGQVQSVELRHGGRDLGVTNENRIRYIHSLAHFRLYKQIKPQIHAFSAGFHLLIKKDWLSMFSAHELQRLISGDAQGDIDTADLKKHVLYFGGFHGKHKVIQWLWDILENDFKREDRAAFLKFVTSCSCPPLLGFAHLQPPFSIRCVEVGDDDDRGDTLGSVLRGFLSVRKTKVVQGRLPTASTCFNLLKLPNYTKKSVLREKLKLAISMNTGFELS